MRYEHWTYETIPAYVPNLRGRISRLLLFHELRLLEVGAKPEELQLWLNSNITSYYEMYHLIMKDSVASYGNWCVTLGFFFRNAEAAALARLYLSEKFKVGYHNHYVDIDTELKFDNEEA